MIWSIFLAAIDIWNDVSPGAKSLLALWFCEEEPVWLLPLQRSRESSARMNWLQMTWILGINCAMNSRLAASNDAVNFLNSSIGSRVAPRNVIMIIASLGILAGVTFSSGMMEVARKGIFNPQFFTMPELMVVFLAVMLTDIILLDLFNTFGLPTSTTVSIVFELLGAAVAHQVPPFGQHVLGRPGPPLDGHDRLRAEGTAVGTAAAGHDAEAARAVDAVGGRL